MSKRQREDHHAREVDISNPTPVYSSNKQHRVEGESLALRSIVRSGRCEDGDFDTEDPITSFFRSVWQAEPRVYRRRQVAGSPSATADDCPLNQVITMGLDGLVILLEASRARFDKQRSQTQAGGADPPLFFQSQAPVQIDEIESTYRFNPFAAYLDGCSVVINHADLLCPNLANLCLDLQRSFPHVYINTYLTPTGAQAVQAHADDRDVFVIQLLGEKKWRVYSHVPVSHPYPHEQVGKGGLAVPVQTLTGPTALDITLCTGDVLYMPRGYVHEAETKSDQMSFHATIAIATHDWTLAGNISELVTRALANVPEYRLAVNRGIGRDKSSPTAGGNESKLQFQIDAAMELVRKTVSAETISEQLATKYHLQNHLSMGKRMHLRLAVQDHKDNESKTSTLQPVIGIGAAKEVWMNTFVRASTDEERARTISSPSPPGTQQSDRGLTVRQQTCEFLMRIIQHLKENKNRSYEVSKLKTFIEGGSSNQSMACDLSILSFVRCCVELGAIALVPLTKAT